MLIGDGSPGRPPRLSHSSRINVCKIIHVIRVKQYLDVFCLFVYLFCFVLFFVHLFLMYFMVLEYVYLRSCVFPISERIKYKVACMCFGAINGSGPAYLSELLHVYTPSCTLSSSSDTRMLEIQQYKRKTHGFRTFSCFGPHIWNSLPQDLRHCATLSSFKAKLKTFLFSQYFHPN